MTRRHRPTRLCDEVASPDCEGMFDDENPPMVEEDTEEMISLGDATVREKVLKKLGNSKHAPLKKGGMADSFAAGNLQLHDIKSIRDKEIEKAEREVGYITAAVQYFKQERNKRRRIMEDLILQEEENADEPELDQWEENYLELVDEGIVR